MPMDKCPLPTSIYTILPVLRSQRCNQTYFANEIVNCHNFLDLATSTEIKNYISSSFASDFQGPFSKYHHLQKLIYTRLKCDLQYHKLKEFKFSLIRTSFNKLFYIHLMGYSAEIEHIKQFINSDMKLSLLCSIKF